jgi:hypothetical protein
VLEGIEAKITTRKGSRVRWPSQKAVMAGLGTLKDFAAHMKERFVLKGPQAPLERKEGGITEQVTPETTTTIEQDALAVPDELTTVQNVQNGKQDTSLLGVVSSRFGPAT